MKSRYNFFDRVSEDETLGPHPGSLDYTAVRKYLISSFDSYYTIPLKYQFRPDLISNLFYNTPTLHWAITYVNEIENAPEGYTINRIIRLPNKQRLFQIL